MNSRFSLVIGACVLALTFFAIPALAHHGWGGNEDKEFEMSGTVTTGVSLSGPHATMKIKDDKGQVWDLTLAPPARTSEAGLKEGIIPVGAKPNAVPSAKRPAGALPSPSLFCGPSNPPVSI